jgi:hypothetical protein
MNVSVWQVISTSFYSPTYCIMEITTLLNGSVSKFNKQFDKPYNEDKSNMLASKKLKHHPC